MLRSTPVMMVAMMALAGCGAEYDLAVSGDDLGLPIDCDIEPIVPEETDLSTCQPEVGTFVPIVEWGAGNGASSRSVPAVADLDGDGLPEIIANFSTGLFLSKGELVILDGHGNELRRTNPGIGYASGPTVVDLDADGTPEILVVRALGSQMPLQDGSYSVAAYSPDLTLLWESATYDQTHFDYATGIAVSDMDHDGSPEIVAGRVILNSDGTEKGVGNGGHGSWGEMPNIMGGAPVTEASLPAIADLDLDGVEEVITGNTWYNPDGSTKWLGASQEDGMVAIANLDGDPEGEVIVSSFDGVRAVDTDGSIMWGPLTLTNANIVSPAAIADLSGDGMPNIVVAGGNQLVALHADGTEYWSAAVQDLSGATGASIFDFDGDGVPEVVYIDETDMLVFDGRTGTVKFLSDEHSSNTMMDYPVIADVDADGQAEIVVAHAGLTRALSVYGDMDMSWAPARRIWNQHAYSINNIEDDLTVPVTAVQAFTTHNTWHSAIDTRLLEGNLAEVTAEIVTTCDTDCEQGRYHVVGRLLNRGEADVPAGMWLSLYAVNGINVNLLGSAQTEDITPAQMSSAPIAFEVQATDVMDMTLIRLVADDDGSGFSALAECDENDNASELVGPFCN